MGYFAVVLSRLDGDWDANDVDLDEVETLGDLADAMRGAAPTGDGEGTHLLFLEQEDAWFAVVRVDGEDDPRVFISDRGAIVHSAYAEMLLEAAGTDDDDLPSLDILAGGFDPDAETEDEPADEPAELDSGPLGEADVLADLGTDAESLVALCGKEGLLPSEILTTLAEQAGAGDALEAVR